MDRGTWQARDKATRVLLFVCLFVCFCLGKEVVAKGIPPRIWSHMLALRATAELKS